MIAAATSSKLLFNWIDVAMVLVLAFGFWRGRKNGISKEILPLFYWLVTIVAAGFGCVILGDLLIKQGTFRQLAANAGFKERTFAYISAYLAIVVAIRIAYTFVKKYLKTRVEGANIFRASEYYLGMGAGVIRYACIIVFALAFINAPYYTPQEIEAERIYNNRWFGGGMQGYSGDFIPSMSELQTLVFKDSLLGPTVKRGVRVLLINTDGNVAPAKPPVVEIQ